LPVGGDSSSLAASVRAPALLDSSFRSPYTMALLATPSIAALDRQQPPVFSASKDIGSRLAWEQKPLNGAGQELVIADYNGRDDTDGLSDGNTPETAADPDLLDSYQY
jgi:hypothetical protein